jgi:hypothetical protein
MAQYFGPLTFDAQKTLALMLQEGPIFFQPQHLNSFHVYSCCD